MKATSEEKRAIAQTSKTFESLVTISSYWPELNKNKRVGKKCAMARDYWRIRGGSM
ncbi:MAG: hypothetical protein AABY47_03790 [Pseudomonadota bacterium]